jgi:translation elongation factor EF-1beta
MMIAENEVDTKKQTLIENESIPDMTVEEATAKHNELKSLHGVMRSMLLEIRDRKGWKALGYESWEQYGEKEWDYSRQHLHRLADAAKVQLIVSPIGDKQIPETHLRPLSQVPDDIKKQIWKQVNEEHEKLTAKMVEEAVAKYKADLEQTELSREGWKSQALEKKKELEESEIRVFNLREARKEIVYVDNAGEVTKELKQENKRLKEKLKEAQDAKIEAIKTTKENMANGLDKIYNDKVARETAQTRRVNVLQEKLNKIEDQVLSVEKHKEAQADYKEALIKQALALMVLEDFPPNEDQTAAWSKLLSDNQLMLNAQVLGNPETQSDHNVIVVAGTDD